MVYLGVDLHRKISHVVALDEAGSTILSRRFEHSPDTFRRVFGELAPEPISVAFEATYGWGWFADLLADAGIEAHMAHPLATKAIGAGRVKNDAVDSATLAQSSDSHCPPGPPHRLVAGPVRQRAGRSRVRRCTTETGAPHLCFEPPSAASGRRAKPDRPWRRYPAVRSHDEVGARLSVGVAALRHGPCWPAVPREEARITATLRRRGPAQVPPVLHEPAVGVRVRDEAPRDDGVPHRREAAFEVDERVVVAQAASKVEHAVAALPGPSTGMLDEELRRAGRDMFGPT
jgi:hypothetical protein